MLEWGVVALEAKVEDLTFCAARIYWLVKYVPIMDKEDLTFHVRIQKILIRHVNIINQIQRFILTEVSDMLDLDEATDVI